MPSLSRPPSAAARRVAQLAQHVSACHLLEADPVQTALGVSAVAAKAPPSELGAAQFISVNGRQLYVVSSGEDSAEGPVICIPGAIGTVETDFAGQLAGLSQVRRVVSFDPRGYGKSRPPARDWPIDFYHRDAADAHAIMQNLGYTSYSVAGWSDGANAAVLLAAKHPEAVKKLVIFGGNAWVEPKDIELYEATRDVKKHWSKGMLSMHLPVYGDDLQPMWDGFCDAMKALLEAGGDICQGEAKCVRCPTLVLAGAKDAMVPMYHAEFYHRNIAGSRLHVFPEGKHNIHIKYRDEFNRIVSEFLSG